jgi:PDZ domain-containing secreted protein/Zn-dependent protease
MELFRVRGVPVRIGWSWLVIFLLVFWSLGTALFPATYPGLAGATYLLMAGAATALFFVSILVHELSHTLQSLREGVPVRDITLWLFGGVSRADEPLPSPGAEFRVVFAGPLASAVLAVAFLGITAAGRALGLSDALVGVPEYLARINALLLGFNVIPALPLDGGRLLHALLWWRLKDSSTATIYAAGAGRAFAAVLIAIGAVSILVGDSFSGIWFVLLGWFLLAAVRQEVLAARVSRAFVGLRVRDLMSTQLLTVEPGMTIREFADLLGRWPSHAAYPVVAHGELAGMLVLRTAGAVPEHRRDSVRVADVMLTASDVPLAHPDDLVSETARVVSQEPGRAIVTEGPGAHQIVGLLSITDLSRALEAAPRQCARRPPSRAGVAIAALAVVTVVLVAAAVYHPPFVLVAPGGSFSVNDDIHISGVPIQQPRGRYLLTSVELSQPNTLVLLAGLLRPDRQVHPVSQVLPSGVSPGAVNAFERGLFADSRPTAAVAAATAAGYRARLSGEGARVLGVVASSPASGALKVGDTITAVDGSPVATTGDLHAALAGRPAGQNLALTVERGRRALTIRVTNARLPQPAGGTGIGVLTATRNLRAVLPFDITFRDRPDVGGPSAGPVYALAITDMLDRSDDANGRAVAATGTIAEDGSVGPVGGVPEKAIAAEGAGADVLLVPVEDLPALADHPLRVLGVKDLQQAVRVLAP